MDSWADPWADTGFLSGEGGPGLTARIQDPHIGPVHRIRTYVLACVRACVRAHTHTQTHTPTQTDRHTCTCIDGKLKYIQINRNCIIM